MDASPHDRLRLLDARVLELLRRKVRFHAYLKSGFGVIASRSCAAAIQEARTAILTYDSEIASGRCPSL